MSRAALGCKVSSVRRYLILVRVAGGRRLLVGGALVRPGQAAIDLVLLLALHRVTGSFAAGGLAVAAHTVGASASMLVQGRLIDRRGTARVVVPLAGGLLVAVAALSATLAVAGPTAVVVVLAGAVGALLPVTGASLRTLWAALLDDPDEQATAFAFESLAQDIGFVAGPAVLGGLAAAVSPIAALCLCGVLIAGGNLIIATVSADRRPAASVVGAGDAGRPGILRPLAGCAAAMFAVGGTLGAIDVSVPAFATQHGSPAISGLLLGAFSVGSVVGGLAYGARAWRSGLQTRLLGCALALAGLVLLPAAAPSLSSLAPALVLAGMPLAAALTTANLLAARRAPASRHTEAFAWLSMTLNAGAALGNVAAGTIASNASANSGFLLASACAVLASILLVGETLVQFRSTRRERDATP